MHRIRLILLGIVLATLAVGCPHVSVVVPHESTPSQVLPPVPPRIFGTGGADPFAWYANERAAKFFYVTDPTMAGVGAKGDNTTDDTAAIVAADAAAKAVLGTVVFPPPAVCYKTTSEIGIHWAAHWLGYAQNVNQPTICAHGSGPRSVVELRSTFGEGAGATPGFLDNAPSRSLIENLTIDAGGTVEVGLLLDGAADSWLRNLHIINATEYGIRNAAVILPATVSGVTVGGTGGSPTTGMSFSQSDDNFLNGTVFAISGSASPLTLVVKISNPGTLGTATYVLSTDGGATFSSLTFPLVGVFNLAKSDSIHYQGSIGVTGHFPAGTYVAGTTYSVTVTPTNSDIAQPEADNNLVIYDTLVVAQSGTIYATPATFLGQYNGFTFTASASGTAGTTSGSQIVTGSGTTWLSQVGCDYGRGAIRVGGTIYEIATVLDDTDLVVVSSPLPSANASGLEYAMSCGAGFYEDGTNENNYTRWIDGDLGQDSIGMMLAAARGMEIDGVHVNSTGLAGIVEGASTDSTVQGALLNKVHTASGTFGSHGVPYIISPNSSGSMNEPQGLVVVGGNPVGWTYRGGGLDGALSNNVGPITNGVASSYMPIAAEALVANIQTVTSNAFTITLPDLAPLQQTAHTSLIDLRASPDFTDYVFTAQPIIPNPGFAGLFLYIRNGSLASTYAFPGWLTSNSGIVGSGEYTTIGPQQTLVLMSTVQAAASPWVVVGVSKTYGNSNQNTASLGNTGETVRKLTTTNATPTTIMPHSCTTLASGAGGIDFDVMANSGAVNAGTNVGSWEHCFLGLDYQCNITAYTCDIVTGTNSDLPPAGWAVTHSTSGTNPMLIQVTGDSSANPVRWVWRGSYREGANF